LNGLWYTLVLEETILLYSRVDRNMMCKNLTSPPLTNWSSCTT